MQPITRCTQRGMAAMILLQDKYRSWYIIFGKVQIHNTHAHSETALNITPAHALDIHLLVRSRLAVICIFFCLFSVLLSSLQWNVLQIALEASHNNSSSICRTAELDWFQCCSMTHISPHKSDQDLVCSLMHLASYLSLVYASNLRSNSCERQCGTFATCWASLADGACVLIQYLCASPCTTMCHPVRYLSAD